MSDEPDRPRVVTAPLAAAPAAPAVNARPATQMSASAVPSTLESPQDPSVSPPATVDGDAVVIAARTDARGAPDEIKATSVTEGDTTRDDAARDAAMAAVGGLDSARRVGPATLMSPAVIAPLPGESTPPLAPENAVIDVGAPAHAYVASYGSAAPPGMGGAGGMMHHGHAGPGAGPPRSMSTTSLVLIVGGVVAGVGLLVVAVVAVLFFTRAAAARRAAEANDSPRSRTVGPSPGPVPVEARPLRMGGTRARVTVTSSGALDPEAVRGAINAALPRLDACFAATELDPPNHESASYDLDVAPNGEVRHAEPTSPGSRSSKLDSCMVLDLRSIRMPRSAKASAVKLVFVAPIEPR